MLGLYRQAATVLNTRERALGPNLEFLLFQM